MPENSTLPRRLVAALAPRDLFRLAVLMAIAALEIDWATKNWALHSLAGEAPLGALVLGVAHNDAFAFSTGDGEVAREVVVALRLGALMLLVLLAATLGIGNRRYAAGLGLMLGGGAGNVADLLFREHGVVDFIGAGPLAIRIGGWEMSFGLVFNLADVAVLVGIGLLAPLIRDWALAMQQRIQRWERRWLTGES